MKANCFPPQGKMPQGWSMDDDTLLLNNTIDKSMAPLAVLFFVPYNTIQAESEKELALLKRCYKKMQDMGVCALPASISLIYSATGALYTRI